MAATRSTCSVHNSSLRTGTCAAFEGSASLISRSPSRPLSIERLRSACGSRAGAVAAAILVEVLLLLLLLGLTPSFGLHREGKATKVFTIAPEAASPRSSEHAAPRQSRATAHPVEIPPPQPAAVAPSIVQAPPPVQQPSPAASPAPSATPTVPAPTHEVYGPPAPGPDPNDTPVVGSAPNGEPLYAASWYREPYDDELRGYLSTAQGPGWALIVCRTVPDFRVEDCAGLSEYPQGSNILRSVLAAAWQFRVRPPRHGGKILWGAWVRIRIDYAERVGNLAPSRR